MTQLPTLYKRTSTGAVQEWTIIVQSGGLYYTRSGQVGGVITESAPTACDRKNVGRSNETTANEQAFADAESKWKKQKDKGYTEDIDNIDSALAESFRPMLAEPFEKEKVQPDNTMLTVKLTIKYPCIGQRKSDGVRSIMSTKGAFSREGTPQCTVPHLLAALKPVFKEYPNLILDGELYNHEYHSGGVSEETLDPENVDQCGGFTPEAEDGGFEKLCSLIKKTKPSVADLFEAEEKIQYHIYDCPQIGNLGLSAKFTSRYKLMVEALTKHGLWDTGMFVLVENYPINSEADLRPLHDKFTSEGYEGLIIRIDGPYENKRTKKLMKYKMFDDDEFIITDILSGNGNKANIAARACGRTHQGKPFRAGIIGTETYAKWLLDNKDELIGKRGTFKFFRYTRYGIPRFAKLKIIRDYE